MNRRSKLANVHPASTKNSGASRGNWGQKSLPCPQPTSTGRGSGLPSDSAAYSQVVWQTKRCRGSISIKKQNLVGNEAKQKLIITILNGYDKRIFTPSTPPAQCQPSEPTMKYLQFRTMRTKRLCDAPIAARCNLSIQTKIQMGNELRDERDTSTPRKRRFLFLKRERDTTQSFAAEA